MSDLKSPELAVEMRGVTKQFPGVLANDHVDFSVTKGEIHALVGENGAGKSTLMNVLYGLVHRDEGEISINGKAANISEPRDAIALGIGMVHQHFMLIPVFSVGENIMLGREPVTGPDFYDRARARTEIKELTKRYGLALDPDARMGDLPVGLQQRAEIVKVLYRGASILILDEPTGVLTPQETKELFVVLRDLVKGGKTIIFISHKLKEVLDISDRITVMRRGRVVGHLTTRETNEEEIATLMVGREVLLRVDKKPAKPGAVLMTVRDLTASSDRNVPALKGVSFELRSGEILGVAGVEGNGQSELMEVLAGTRKATGGKVLLGNRDITTMDARTERDAGVAFIPEDRRGTGLVLAFSIAENSILGRERNSTFSWHELVLKLVAIRDWARRLVKEFDIRTPSIDVAARNLSGGNQQKVIVAREMGSEPKVLLAAQPTRGVDIGAIEFIHRQIV
ncbi:MAG TPA: ABC transporter ATP-binding protein, partial [Candidatus Dormibacteraeota bacterium]|nr:ABC transporter ATP-binding protein [Candidatus Dormibacteraeota bacterium]